MTEIFVKYDFEHVKEAERFKGTKPPAGSIYLGMVQGIFIYHLWINEGIYYTDTDAGLKLKEKIENIKKEQTQKGLPSI